MDSPLSSDQKRALRYIVSLLQGNNISFQITGGLAAVLYGARRPVYDIDIDVCENDIPKIREIFLKDIVTDYHHLQDEKFDLYLLILSVYGVSVDISQLERACIYDVRGERVEMQSDIARAKNIAWEDMALPVQDKQELITYKTILNRDIDLSDIQEMSK